MPYVTLGASTELQIKVPTNGFTGWGDTMRTDTFLKIAQHNHTGSGNGSQLGTGSLLADAVTGAKIRLDNDEYIRARNAADSANINVLKIDTNDQLYIDPQISKLLMKNNTFIQGRDQADSASIDILKIDGGDDLHIDPQVSNFLMKNNTYVLGRNNANSANIDMWRVTTSDLLEPGANIVTATVNALTTPDITANGSVTLTDNTSTPATASVITLTSNQSAIIHYKIVRSTDVVSGSLEIEQSNANIIREEVGDDVGVTFSLSSDALYYATTNTGNNATMTYTIIKR